MSEKILEVHNVTKKFGGLVANDAVSIHLNRGEILGLIGSNGAGKTTLFNIIAGSLKPSQGEIIYNGKHLEKMTSYKICQLGIGRTYQIVQPFASLTVLENVLVGCLLHQRNVDLATERANSILEFVGLHQKRDIIGKSLGLPDLKKMEMARALATNPEVLLLDEVMAGLNPSESAEMIKIVKKINEQGITIIIIEHVMKVIMTLSDRIYVLNQGKLIAEGTPGEVSTNKEVQASYFGEKSYANN